MRSRIMKQAVCAQCGHPLPITRRYPSWVLIALALLPGLLLALCMQALLLVLPRSSPSAAPLPSPFPPTTRPIPTVPPVPAGTLLLDYHGHTNRVTSLAWSPDGTRIASASKDGTIQIWDAASGGHVLTDTGDGSWVWAVAWSPNGKLIASGTFDGAVQV